MSKWHVLFVLGLIILISVCSEQKEYRISIMYTNAHGKDVKHGGYYRLHSGGDSVPMNGYTPSEYVVTMLEGDTLFGCCWKDTMSSDTLWFDLYVNGESELAGILPMAEINFQYPTVGVEP